MSTNEAVLTCECGAKVDARFQDAGGQLDCGCGRVVKVPSLSKLRKLAGHDAYTTNAVEAIRKRLNQGQLPAGLNCLVCGAARCPQQNFVAICEATYRKGADSSAGNDIPSLMSKLLLVFAAPRLLALLLMRRNEDVAVQQFGRHTSVEISLPVCDSCVSAGHNTKSGKNARTLMRQVPLYDQLLTEFPNLELERR